MARATVPKSKRQYVQGINSEAMRLARSLPKAKQTIFPGFIEPSLATLAGRAPRGEQWVHEVKYDGYRFQCHVERKVRFFTRRGNDWSERLSHIVTTMGPLTDRSMILDGEVIVQSPEGRSDFHALEKELQVKGGSKRLVFYVFDVLYLGGFDLREVPLLDRKGVLQELLKGINKPIRFSEHLRGDGPSIWKRACELDLEGVVSKRADARYVSHRNPYWIKVPCRHRDTFHVVGWAEKANKFDGIYLGRDEGDALVYAGKLERGFSEEDKRAILARLAPLKIRKQPMTASRKSFPKAQWVKPLVMVDAEFRGRTGDGLLRHPAFKGIREDLAED